MANNLYLAKKYRSAGFAPLYPRTAQGEAEAWRWILWARGDLEPWMQRDAKLERLRQIMDAARARREWFGA